jgi:hypothetical protein
MSAKRQIHMRIELNDNTIQSTISKGLKLDFQVPEYQAVNQVQQLQEATLMNFGTTALVCPGKVGYWSCSPQILVLCHRPAPTTSPETLSVLFRYITF